jgi:predicted Rossmann fold nucleotide-binding protein DprA/Smf involved in DNA uptake
MKLAIVGSRSFTDFDLFKSKIDEFILQNVINKKDIIIISGGAKGTDSLAKRYAIENDIQIIEYLPDWNLYGRSAGMIRNMDIVKNCDKL